MSAAEIIEEIKTLPADEVERIRDYLRNGSSREASDKDFDKIVDRVLTRYAPLMERLAK